MLASAVWRRQLRTVPGGKPQADCGFTLITVVVTQRISSDFHGTEYFKANWDKYSRYPWTILAHAAHVRGAATYERGVEVPRIRLTLASQIPRQRCEKVDLGYRDPRSIDLSYWKQHTEEGYLYVPSAGEHLYKLREAGVGPAAER